MNKTLEEMAEEWADWWNEDPEYRIAYDSFIAGYKAAKQEYEAKIQELETQLENWQHNAKHGDEGL